MFEAIIIGIIQGIAEWLPISSEGAIILAEVNLFSNTSPLSTLLSQAVFLHLGTFLAALIYFRREVWQIIKTLFSYRSARTEDKQLFNFLFFTNLISGILGGLLLGSLFVSENYINLTGQIVTGLIGVLLLITAALQFSAKAGTKNLSDLTTKDTLLLGFVQGLAALPGFSRSGLTVSTLLLRRFNDTTALTLSFLMSLPIVLVGNIALNFTQLNVITPELLAGFIASFIFGLLTIHLLLKLARHINFAWFVLVFGCLSIIAAFF